MTKQRKTYKTFTPEFKREAVRLMETSERPTAEIARELGIPRNRLYKWKDQLAAKGDKAFSGSGRPRKQDQSAYSNWDTHSKNPVTVRPQQPQNPGQLPQRQQQPAPIRPGGAHSWQGLQGHTLTRKRTRKRGRRDYYLTNSDFASKRGKVINN